jgi:hypothetical protein
LIGETDSRLTPILFLPNVQMTTSAAPAEGDIVSTLQFFSHQEIFDRAVADLLARGRTMLMESGGSAYRRGYCGGCPVGSFIRPRDYVAAIEGVPVRYIARPLAGVPAYMRIGVTQLRRALLRARINVYDPLTIDLLGQLQRVHDVHGVWEWQARLVCVARHFKLNANLVETAA